jgi:hypothetical protein
MLRIEEIIFGKYHEITSKLTCPYSRITQIQDCIFPAPEALSFQNHLVAVLDAKEKDYEFNFVLSDGSKS